MHAPFSVYVRYMAAISALSLHYEGNIRNIRCVTYLEMGLLVGGRQEPIDLQLQLVHQNPEG